jgi:hypothetical protein
MGCLFAVFAGLFPRLGVLLIWLARPALFSAAFGGSWLLPLLGVLLLPFTTLMYALVWTPGVGVVGAQWIWIALGFLIDISSAIGAQYGNKRMTTAV